jgi:hypothetical protein
MLDEKQRLTIELEEMGAEKDLFASMTSSGYAAEGNTSLKVNLLSFLAPKADNGKTVEQNITLVSGDISRLRNQLTQILEQFMLQSHIDISAQAIAYAGTGITDSATYKMNILRQDVLDLIYKNMVNRFIQLFNLVPNKEPVRFKLIRQSKDKHYATIPKNFIVENPFIELMTVNKAASRLKFTPYELKEGLNDGTPTSASTAESKDSTTAGPGVLPGAGTNPFAPAASANIATTVPAVPIAVPQQATVDVFAAPVAPIPAAPAVPV